MLWVCQGCTAAYSVDAPRCPQCGSTEYEEDGNVPKTTVHTGDSQQLPDGTDLVNIGAPTVGAPRVGEGENGPELTDLPEGATVKTDAPTPPTKAAPAKAAQK